MIHRETKDLKGEVVRAGRIYTVQFSDCVPVKVMVEMQMLCMF